MVMAFYLRSKHPSRVGKGHTLIQERISQRGIPPRGHRTVQRSLQRVLHTGLRRRRRAILVPPG